jgi:hypothetical protein
MRPARRRVRPAIRRLLSRPSSPWTLFLRTALACTLAGVVTFGLGLRKIEPLPLSSAPLQFDGARAHGEMRTLAKGFPGRVPWSESRKKAALWLKSRFESFGYAPQGMTFSEVIAGKSYTDLENIYAEKRGSRLPNEVIVVAAHYDVTDTTQEGAMDDASGVGVVLELARILSQIPNERTWVFLATDSEEFGAFWGARQFARRFEGENRKIAGVINLDFLAPEKQVSVLTLCDGLKAGYTPLWLREMALDSLRSIGGFEVADFQNIMEFFERAILIPPADHGAFLAEGIPAFNWVGQTADFAHQMAHYHHTPNDVAEAMQPESFNQVGKAAERLIRSIDALPKLPENFRNPHYWKISDQLYLDGPLTFLLHLLCFVPFIVYTIARVRLSFRNHTRREIRSVIQNEAKNMGILAGSFLVGYAVMLLLPALRVITSYEIFPATQKSLILYTPNFLAITLVVGTVLLVHTVFRKAFAEKEDEQPYPELRHAFYGGVLTLIIGAAFAKNSFQAVLLLLPPAYLWMALRSRNHGRERVLNAILLMGGALSFVLMTVVMATVFHIGVVYWYLFLAAAYGLISAYAVVLFFLALTILIRLFHWFVIQKEPTS